LGTRGQRSALQGDGRLTLCRCKEARNKTDFAWGRTSPGYNPAVSLGQDCRSRHNFSSTPCPRNSRDLALDYLQWAVLQSKKPSLRFLFSKENARRVSADRV